MKKVILTGGAGFVGSAVIKELLQNDVKVWAVVRPGFSSRLSMSRLAGLPINYVECDLKDLRNLPAMLEERDFDVWYQFAWDGLFGEELTDYHKQAANIVYMMNAITAAAFTRCRKFVGAGSVSQYELFMPADKNQEGDKHRVYKAAKMSCQYLGAGAAASQNIEFIWPIITNIYGAGEKSTRLINSMIRKLQNKEHQALSRGDQFYDFIYITDAAKAFRLIGEHGRENRNYIIAQGMAGPLRDFLNVVKDVVDPKAELGFGELAFNGYYLPKECYDITQLAEDTGFVPEITFEEGIRLTSDWIRSGK